MTVPSSSSQWSSTVLILGINQVPCELYRTSNICLYRQLIYINIPVQLSSSSKASLPMKRLVLKKRLLLISGAIQYYLNISVHLKSGLIREMAFGWSYLTWEEGYGDYCHFQQYFCYMVVVIFIVGGNQSTWRKPPNCRQLLTNFIT